MHRIRWRSIRATFGVQAPDSVQYTVCRPRVRSHSYKWCALTQPNLIDRFHGPCQAEWPAHLRNCLMHKASGRISHNSFICMCWLSVAILRGCLFRAHFQPLIFKLFIFDSHRMPSELTVALETCGPKFRRNYLTEPHDSPLWISDCILDNLLLIKSKQTTRNGRKSNKRKS